jgi:hypothetical protein
MPRLLEWIEKGKNRLKQLRGSVKRTEKNLRDRARKLKILPKDKS